MASRQGGKQLVNVLVAAGVATALLGVVMLVDLNGWTYYLSPMRVRGYSPPHQMLKPSGTVAHPLGVVGVMMLFVPMLYVLRKRWKGLANTGSLATWLEVHVFCGVMGPVLVTFHSAFKFNGMISVAYWSMMTVMLSGFVGRYLYVRIPKSIRGIELTRDEIQAAVAELAEQLAGQGVEPVLLRQLTTSEVLTRRHLRDIRKTLVAGGISRQAARQVTSIASDRSVLLKRLAYLNRTKELFAAWHVLHQPLVYVMFIIAAVHVGVAVYFGYS